MRGVKSAMCSNIRFILSRKAHFAVHMIDEYRTSKTYARDGYVLKPRLRRISKKPTKIKKKSKHLY